MSPASTSAAGSGHLDEQGSPTAAAASSKGPPSAIEFEPPLACVRRILKHTLPTSTNVGKDASAAFARASGIFIIYLTACANDFARENRRQTITANDVLAAIKELEFDEFTPELTTFLERYRDAEKSKKLAKSKAAAAAKAEEDGGDEDDHESADGEGESKAETPKSTKAGGKNLSVEDRDGEATNHEEKEDQGPEETDEPQAEVEGDAMAVEEGDDDDDEEMEE